MKKSLEVYIVGFLLSLICTLAAYILVTIHFPLPTVQQIILLIMILLLAFIQLTVQLIFFLHLGFNKKEGWKLALFISTVGAVFVIVVGSLWIMGHLNYNMTSTQMMQYINDQSGF